jgi:hypothetical protein
MPLYGAAVTTLYPNQQLALFDGTESPASGVKSAAFRCHHGSAQVPGGQVFTVTFASSATATVLIQASNDDVEAHYATVGTIPFAGVTTPGYYADLGNFKFYRANLSAYTGGGMPTVLVQR